MSKLSTTSRTGAPAYAAPAPAKQGSMLLDRWVTAIASHVVLILASVVIVYPVIWMFFASFKSRGEIVSNIWGPPSTLQWTNYVGAWQTAKLGYALMNSIITSIGTVLIVILLASIAGYAFARFSFRLAPVILLIFVFTMQAPPPSFRCMSCWSKWG